MCLKCASLLVWFCLLPKLKNVNRQVLLLPFFHLSIEQDLQFSHNAMITCIVAGWSNDWGHYGKVLRTSNHQEIFEAYNWVVSICLKYVSLPCIMVNSLMRGASEPCAWREFYKHQTWQYFYHSFFIWYYCMYYEGVCEEANDLFAIHLVFLELNCFH